MADYQTLLVNKNDGVTTITFNRPEKRNAMSPQLHREMYDLLNDLRYDKQTRVIIITGAGESFCAGQDLKQYVIEMDSQPDRVRDEVREKSRQWRNEILRKMPQPVIAKINGWVFGGGFTVVTGCDIAIAADDIRLGLSEVNFGHFPGGEVTIVLTEHLQPKHGLYYALTGKTMSAKEAERIGLITKAVPRADLDKEVMEIANNLKEKAPSAVQALAQPRGEDPDHALGPAGLEQRGRRARPGGGAQLTGEAARRRANPPDHDRDDPHRRDPDDGLQALLPALRQLLVEQLERAGLAPAPALAQGADQPDHPGRHQAPEDEHHHPHHDPPARAPAVHVVSPAAVREVQRRGNHGQSAPFVSYSFRQPCEQNQ